MARLRRKKTKTTETNDEDFIDNYRHKEVVGFHPHCYVQQLAVAEAKQFDEIYALAHAPVRGDEEETEA